MKILCDFDGVLTDISEEAKRAQEIFTQTLVQNSGWESGRVAVMLDRGQTVLQKAPHRYGWPQKGRLAAYADEDSFLSNMGLSHCLDELSQAEGGDFLALRGRLNANNIASFNQVSMDSYQRMTEETRRGDRNPLDAEAVRFLHEAVEGGHRVTIVSNSSSQRILDLLVRQGFQPADREKDSSSPLGVRGGAAKFELGDKRVGFFAGPYWIDAARPKYEKILREENPDAVIGDVFSLDLGLPLFLTRTEPDRFGGMKLFLRERSYTPGWVRSQPIRFIRDLKILQLNG